MLYLSKMAGVISLCTVLSVFNGQAFGADAISGEQKPKVNDELTLAKSNQRISPLYISNPIRDVLLRAGPSTSYHTGGAVYTTYVLKLFSVDGEWYEVRNNAGYRTGWIHENDLNWNTFHDCNDPHHDFGTLCDSVPSRTFHTNTDQGV